MFTMHLDLQIHSYHSDGERSPADIVERAMRVGLEALAITDHNVIAPETVAATAAARRAGIRSVLGAEISCRDARRAISLHLLAYGIPEDRRDAFNDGLRAVRDGYDRRAKAIIAKLNGEVPGLALDFATMKHGEKDSMVSRNHLAMALQRFTGEEAMDIREATRRAFVAEDDAWMPDIREMIAFVHGMGGVAVLAHPGSRRPDAQEAAFAEYVAAGLDGFEVWSPAHDPAYTYMLQQCCAERGLLMTAGSDWHGETLSPDKTMGMMMPADEAMRFLQKVGAV